MNSPDPTLTATPTCPVCGLVHRFTPVPPGGTLRCQRCDTVIQPAHGSHSSVLALVTSGIILAVPALALPLVTVSKLGNENDALLASGLLSLWRDGHWELAVLVLVCGVIAPLFMLGALGTVLIAISTRWRRPFLPTLLRWMHHLEQWSMPEVHLLAFMVAFTKLSSLVDVNPGSGLWCYSVMSVLALLAWKRFDAAGAAAILQARPA